MTVQIPQYLQALGVPAKLDRQLLADFFNGGVNAAASLAVTSTGAPRSVAIAGGAAYVPGTTTPVDQGTYRVYNDASVTLVHDAASTNPRVDQIIVRVYDTQYGAGTDAGSIEIVKGTEASGATLLNRTGAVPDGSMPATFIRLCDVLVPVGASPVIPSGNIQDRRALAGLKAGGQVPIGAVIPWTGSGDPGDGYWIAADGRLIDKTIYSIFFTRTGHAYNGGVDPGSNKVRSPDKRGRGSVGAISFGTDGVNGVVALSGSDNARVNIVRGASTGERNHTLTSAESGVNGSGATTSSGSGTSGNPDDVSHVQGFEAVAVTSAGGGAPTTEAYKGGSTNRNDNGVYAPSSTPLITHKHTTPAHSHPLTARTADSAHNVVHPVEADNYIVRIA